MPEIDIKLAWRPQIGPQLAAIDTALFADELLFGGARGGGKTDFLLGDFLADVGRGYGADWRGVIFRKTYPECEELIARAKEIYPICFPGAVYHQQNKMWTMPDGATLKIRSLDHDDADKFQGHSFTWIGWDELGNWPNALSYRKLKACLRSRAPVVGKRIRASANPGGAGHDWVKKYFAIDRYPHGGVLLHADDDHGCRMFIKSRLSDNHILTQNDPHYASRLRQVGNAELVKAWLDGDWNAIAGAFFTEWDARKHVIPPFRIPPQWGRFVSFDWGSSSPFSAGWWAVVSDDYVGSSGELLPRGALVRYREWYGADKNGYGLKLNAEEVAREIISRTIGENLSYAVADPSIFRVDGGPSIAERMGKCGLYFKPADNARIAGWDQLRARLRGDGERPQIYCFQNCVDSIRTIPTLMHARDMAEDINSDGEDHAADDWRYACMSRPYAKKPQMPKNMIAVKPVTYDDLMQNSLPHPKHHRL